MRKQEIEQFLAETRIGIVGISRNGEKLSNNAYQKLKDSGYQLYPVHPEMDYYDGDKCVSSIDKLPGDVKALMLIAGPEVCLEVLRNISETSINHVWVFSGKSSRPDVEQRLRTLQETGISVISGVCPFMFVEPVRSVHAIHRFFVRLTGNFPK